MTLLSINNPFSAPVFHEETVSSTMLVSRELAVQGQPHGTVITADFQEAGRGRIIGRVWEMERGSSLAFTIMLRYPGIQAFPAALTLRTGLAVCLAIEDFAPALNWKLRIKWPNDILIDTRKVCGIMTEADNGTVHIGIGVNLTQNKFPPHLRDKAASLSLASGLDISPDSRFKLLEKILHHLYVELSPDAGDWRSRIEGCLYKKGEQVSFANGAVGSGEVITGILAGIGECGELLITPESQNEPLAFFSGELC